MYNLIGEQSDVQDLKNQFQNLSSSANKLSSNSNTQTPLSQFTKDIATILGIPEENFTNFEAYNDSLDQQTRANYAKLFTSQYPDLQNALIIIARQGKFDEVLNQLNSYSGQMTEGQKKALEAMKSQYNSFKDRMSEIKNMSQEDFNKLTNTINPQQNQVSQTSEVPQQNQGEKINTTNDRSYDYKLSGGKYYYSKKGQNNWVEAKEKGLKSIKSKVKF